MNLRSFSTLGFAFHVAPGGDVPTKSDRSQESAAKAKNPFIKRAFEEVAAGWRILAEQIEWTDRQKPPLNDEESSD